MTGTQEQKEDTRVDETQYDPHQSGAEEHYRSPASASHVEMTERIANIVRRAVSGAWPEGQIEFEIAELVREAQRSASASASHMEIADDLKWLPSPGALHEHMTLYQGLRAAVASLDPAARDEASYGEWDAAKWSVFHAAVRLVKTTNEWDARETQSPASVSHVETEHEDTRAGVNLRRMDTPENRAFWDSVERAKQEWEASRPDWSRPPASASVRREDECQVHPASSRVCERGTMSCTVRHSVEEP